MSANYKKIKQSFLKNIHAYPNFIFDLSYILSDLWNAWIKGVVLIERKDQL